MNFNVHRRNKSLVSQSKLRDKRQHKSNIKLGPNPSQLLLQQAKDIYYSQHNLQQAIRLFQQYLSQHPRHNQSLYLSAVSYLHLNQSEQAIQKLMMISEEYENKANAMLLAAMALNKIGNANKSLEIVNQCIKKYQYFEEAICFRGKLYINMNFYHKAEQDFKLAINLPKASFLSFVGLADCFRFQGKTQKALTFYFKAIQVLKSGGTMREDNHKYEIQLKIAICLYQMQKYEQSHAYLHELAKRQELKSSQLFYYLGQCQVKLNMKQKGMLNLQYCLRLQTNFKIIKKAYKKLILLFLQNNQFYEALNIIKLGQICKLKLQNWKKVVQSFMLIIKGQYEDGVKELTNICDLMKTNEQIKRVFKIKRDSSDDKSRRDNRYQFQNKDFTKKITFGSPSRAKDNYSREKINKKIGYFSTKSVIRAVPKIESTRLNVNSIYSIKKDDTVKFKTQHTPKSDKQDKQKQIFNSKEKEQIYPLILLFKAYGQFFMNNFMKCLDTYDQYQTYNKDVFGKQSDVDYNKTLCEALLMAQSEMQDEALVKYSNCIDLYFQKYGSIPAEPLLYKIILLMRLAIIKSKEDQLEDQEDASFHQILESTLQMTQNYKAAIGNHHLSHYYKSLIYILLQRYEDSRDALQKTLKITEECSWKFLYVKGVVEMILGNYYDAVKQFSAGLILQSRPQFYLGRSISFLMLGQKQQNNCQNRSIKMLMKSVHISSELSATKEQGASKSKDTQMGKSDLLIQNSFQDLQKYIQLQNNQQLISLWVSKILFANKAYDEAIRSLTKITHQSEQVISMIECIQIYQGEFVNGGAVGYVIKSAFDGHFLQQSEQHKILNQKIVKNYNSSQYGYLTHVYQKWLVVLHLYTRQNYSILLKYLQKQIFSCQDDFTQVLLRYNVALIYYIQGQFNKGINVIKGLSKYQQKYDIKRRIAKLSNLDFDQDQCLQQLREQIGINCNKLLSSYLPNKPINIVNSRGQKIRIYLKINVPFPAFNNPSLQLKINHSFILEELKVTNIQKKIQAPWIKKIKNKTIQFTQKLQESVSDLDQLGNTKSVKDAIQIEQL